MHDAHPPSEEDEEGHHELQEVVAECLEAVHPPRGAVQEVGHRVGHRLCLRDRRGPVSCTLSRTPGDPSPATGRFRSRRGFVGGGTGLSWLGKALPPAARKWPRCELPGQGWWGPMSRPSREAGQGHSPPVWFPVILTRTPQGPQRPWLHEGSDAGGQPMVSVLSSTGPGRGPEGQVTGAGGATGASLRLKLPCAPFLLRGRAEGWENRVSAPSVCSWEHMCSKWAGAVRPRRPTC